MFIDDESFIQDETEILQSTFVMAAEILAERSNCRYRGPDRRRSRPEYSQGDPNARDRRFDRQYTGFGKRKLLTDIIT